MNNLLNFIPYQTWWDIINRSNISAGEKDFDSKVIHTIANYYDENFKYLDMEKIQEFESTTPSWVLVPKFFWLENFHKFDGLEAYIDYKPRLVQYQKQPISLNEMQNIYTCNITPRPEQVPMIDTLMDYRTGDELFRGILQATAGSGKTKTTIMMIEKLKFQKPIIIVPKEILADQWKIDFMESTDLKEEDIFLLEGSNIEEIKKGLQCKVIITKIQSLLSQLKRIPYDELLSIYNEIDLMVFDECHSSGAKGYGKVSSIFGTNNIFGLTATPYRRGEAAFMLKNSIGNVIYKSEHKNVHPDVEIFKLPTSENSPMEFNQKDLKTLGWAAKDYIKFLTFHNMLLYEKDFYFEYLARWTFYQQLQGHNSVVLFSTNKMIDKFIDIYTDLFSDRFGEIHAVAKLKNPNISVEPLKLIGNSKTDSQTLAKAENRKLREKTKEIKAYYDAKYKAKELSRKEATRLYSIERDKLKEKMAENLENALDIYRNKIKDSNLLVSNFQLLSAGFDKANLSHIIFGSVIIGKVTVLQSIGRIARLFEGKKHPLVQFFFTSTFLDFNDKSSMILYNNIKSEYQDSKIKYLGF